MLWQAGNWTLTEAELSRLSSWGAQKFYAMTSKKRNPHHSIGEHWKHMHRVGHELAARFSMDLCEKVFEVKHRFAAHFARLQQSSIPFQVLSLRDLAWWRKQQTEHAKLNDKWHGFHPQRFHCWRWESVLKSLSNNQPDQRTVTQPIWAACESRKTVLLG